MPRQSSPTPTGAAIIATAASRFGAMPPMTIERIGYAVGSRVSDPPRILRCSVGTALLARRARGIDDGGGWVARVGSFRKRSFTLLVAAIRRGVRLALAMDARGFATLTCRTIARPQRFTDRDRALLLATLAVAIGTIALGGALGTWRGLLH